MKTIVVTGATSMMGMATINAALNDGVKKIYAVIRPDSSNINRIPNMEKIVFIPCELGKYDMLPNLIPDNCDTFYHFAWEASRKEKKDRYFDVEVAYRNIGYALQAYQTACMLHCKNFVGAGSQAEYGNLREEIQKPDDITSPVTCYAIAKDTIRRLLMIKSKETGVNVQWVRIFSVYGVNDRSNTLVSSLISKMLNNEEVMLTECKQIWDYLFESDAGNALYLIGRDSQESEIFCLGSGESKVLREYVEEIKDVTNSTSKIHYGEVPMGADAVSSMRADISKIKEKTSWNGPMIPFRDGIFRIIFEKKKEE